MLCYPATSKVCKTPSADVQEALPTVPTQLLQNSNNKLTYKTYLHSPCNSAVKLDSKLLCHFVYFPLVLSVIEETKTITISKRKQDAVKWIGSKEITFLVWKYLLKEYLPAWIDGLNLRTKQNHHTAKAIFQSFFLVAGVTLQNNRSKNSTIPNCATCIILHPLLC